MQRYIQQRNDFHILELIHVHTIGTAATVSSRHFVEMPQANAPGS